MSNVNTAKATAAALAGNATPNTNDAGVATTNIPASPNQVAKAPDVENTLQQVAASTKLGTEVDIERTFIHSIPMSSYIFKNGKTIQFRGGEYTVATDEEFEELMELSRICGLVKPANGSVDELEMLRLSAIQRLG